MSSSSGKLNRAKAKEENVPPANQVKMRRRPCFFWRMLAKGAPKTQLVVVHISASSWQDTMTSVADAKGARGGTSWTGSELITSPGSSGLTMLIPLSAPWPYFFHQTRTGPDHVVHGACGDRVGFVSALFFFSVPIFLIFISAVVNRS